MNFQMTWTALTLASTFVFCLSAHAKTSSVSPGAVGLFHTIRLTPGQDLKSEILSFAKINAIKAGSIVTAVGSLKSAHIRYANADVPTELTGPFEVVSLTGTFNESYGHFHISIADGNGKVIGGHLKEPSPVFTTLEVTLLESKGIEFARTLDPMTKSEELDVRQSKKAMKK